MRKFLIIQTAFIGDAILATGLAEKLHALFPEAETDILVRRGNESLFREHPYLHQVLVWDKKGQKWKNLYRLLRQIRKRKYDRVINVQRFFATGLLTAFSGAKETIGFDKNPLSFLFSHKVRHVISTPAHPLHEIERNNGLIKHFTDDRVYRPGLYPAVADYEKVAPYKVKAYICIAPASVWFTKQYPKEKWVDFINRLPEEVTVCLIGGKEDTDLCDYIVRQCHDANPADHKTNPANHDTNTAVHGTNTAGRKDSFQLLENRELSDSGPLADSGQYTFGRVISLAGQLNLLQSAALMKDALMNYVNDSAPMHLASAVNAPVTAVYCSTLPAFGFGPLSDRSYIVEIERPLSCRPCGLHGLKACPLQHFKCAREIEADQLIRHLTFAD